MGAGDAAAGGHRADISMDRGSGGGRRREDTGRHRGRVTSTTGARAVVEPSGPAGRIGDGAVVTAAALDRTRALRRRFSACLLMMSDLLNATAALAMAAALWAPLGAIERSAPWLRREGPALMLLAVGAGALSGLYRSSSRNPFERFRQRSRAAIVFVFAAALLLLREDLKAALTVVPTAAALALIFGLWGEAWIA